MRFHIAALFLLGVICLLIPDWAWAQNSGNDLDRIVELYRDNAKKWESTLSNYAQSLFWLLAGIEFVFAAIMLVFRNADFSEWLGELVKQIFFLGFFLALLQNSSTWANAIVSSFRQAASGAAQANGVTGGIGPSDVFDAGLQVAGIFWNATSLLNIAASPGLLICALVVIICFAMITAFLIAALVESYVVISAGVLFMGFGGSRWTKDFALKILIYAVSVGAKLFILELIVALGVQIFRDLATNVQTSSERLFVIIGCAVVMLAVTRTIPEMVQGLINGTSVGNGGAMLGGATGAVTGTAAGVWGAGMLASGAVRRANAQSEAGKDAGVGGARRVAGWFGNLSRNIAGGIAHNIGDRLSGQAGRGTRMSETGQKLNEQAGAQRRRNEEERNRKAQEAKPGTKKP